jgi:hypothetical protein
VLVACRRRFRGGVTYETAVLSGAVDVKSPLDRRTPLFIAKSGPIGVFNRPRRGDADDEVCDKAGDDVDGSDDIIELTLDDVDEAMSGCQPGDEDKRKSSAKSA